jgi:hypothetical protein
MIPNIRHLGLHMPDTMVDLAERSGQLCSGLDHFPSLPYTNKHIDSARIWQITWQRRGRRDGEKSLFHPEQRSQEERKHGEYLICLDAPCVSLPHHRRSRRTRHISPEVYEE